MVPRIPPNLLRRAAAGLLLLVAAALLVFGLTRFTSAAAWTEAGYRFEPLGFSVVSNEHPASASFQAAASAGSVVVSDTTNSSSMLYLPMLLNGR